MAKIKKEDIIELTTEEIVQRIDEEKTRYAKMRFNNVVSQLDNAHAIRSLRRDVARLKTELKKRQMDGEREVQLRDEKGEPKAIAETKTREPAETKDEKKEKKDAPPKDDTQGEEALGSKQDEKAGEEQKNKEETQDKDETKREESVPKQ